MKKIIFLLIISTFALNFHANCQTARTFNSRTEAEAYFRMKGRNKNYGSPNANKNYPKDALRKQIEGDVILSVIIEKDSTLTNIALVRSAHKILTTHVFNEIDSLKKKWSPAMLDNKTVNKEYLMVYRYKLHKDQALDYKKKGLKFIKKEKYKKALKLYNKAIVDNPYDFELFESLAKVKEAVGDKEAAKKDFQTAIYLQENILSVKTIIAPDRKKVTIGYATTRIEGRKSGTVMVRR